MKLAVQGLSAVVVASCALAFAACAASSTFTGSSGTGGTGGAATGTNGTTGSPTGSTGVLGTGGNIAVSGTTGTGMGGAGMTYAYAHTNTDLYQFVPPAAATDPINMNLVGPFDCIGGGSSSSSSSGSSGGAPTCAEANGSAGCCVGNTEYYCSSGTVKSSTCTGSEVCTWNTSKGYYSCGAGPAKGENGGAPLQCQTGGGSSSSSSGGGTQDSSMTDIAVDSAGNLWGVSSHNAYQLVIEGANVHCEKTISLQNVPSTFYALSFAPAGVIGATETLIAGNTAGQLWKIDTTTGALEQHGSFGNVPASDGHGHTYANANTAWELSGDIVFLADSGGSALGFATVRDCPTPPSTTGCNTSDTLIEIDTGAMATAGSQNVATGTNGGIRGQITKATGCTDPTASYGSLYGIAAWNSTIYGFSHGSAATNYMGYVVEISNVDGTACAVSGTNTTESWSGAAVTTIAPIIPPPPPM